MLLRSAQISVRALQSGSPIIIGSVRIPLGGRTPDEVYHTALTPSEWRHDINRVENLFTPKNLSEQMGPLLLSIVYLMYGHIIEFNKTSFGL